MFNIPEHIQATALLFQTQQPDPISLFIYDLEALQQHVQNLVDNLPPRISLYYAIKANSEVDILNTIAPLVDGFEISSGGEIAKIEQCKYKKPFVFSGPGKLDSDLKAAIANNVEFIHVESLNEIKKINQIAATQNKQQDILIRINPHLPSHLLTKLSMAGTATPFGIDEQDLHLAISLVEQSPNLRLCGFHVHAMSHQTQVNQHLELMQWYLKQWQLWKSWAKYPASLQYFNVGGGIGVNYLSPLQFDWQDFCNRLNQLQSKFDDMPLLRFEMGRFISAFCGYYVIEVLDIKRSHKKNFLVCRGGTHQFRLPAAQAHAHPIMHFPKAELDHKISNEIYDIVGQLCTPKDVLSRDQKLNNIKIGDLLYLPLAGAYGYNISHADFLCHPRPEQLFVHRSLNI
ncbi:type III PLP-dependent enzyme [Acinetobacter sp. R933-2]|uniref:type III PLP-dependent enzyme n=1 Tax=unclassified Acinetobacter TaxID=196816 RepID=UPI0025783933|nr:MULTISPECIES: type III PLP-dependent enzyme [unclassified Acinetobacter]MDM1249193.1 type III PLP-dependent enzyme [Acinetobacter sp. R933-2]MDM1769356.1 type III PLP-dependent enzyme [Acinetobacter sp. 226-4]